jgi:hypothetical protein
LLSNRQFLVAQIADAQAQAEACGYIFITFMIATWYELANTRFATFGWWIGGWGIIGRKSGRRRRPHRHISR